MKIVMDFTVCGISKEEVYSNACKAYNKFTETVNSELPHNTVIEVSPLVENGTGEVSSWQGVVHISENLR